MSISRFTNTEFENYPKSSHFCNIYISKIKVKIKIHDGVLTIFGAKIQIQKREKNQTQKREKIQMRHFSSIFKHCGNIQFWLTLDITSSEKHLSMTSQDSRKDSSCRQMSHDLFNAYFLFLKRISLPHFQTHAVGKVLVIFSRKSSLPG